MHASQSLVLTLLAASASAYTPPADQEDGVYIVPSAGFSSKFRRDYGAPIRIGDIVAPTTKRTDTSPLAARDDITQHIADSGKNYQCQQYNTMMLADYTLAMNSLKSECDSHKVPPRKKGGLFNTCSGAQGILYAKAGGSIVYHCNSSCEEQNCGAGHLDPFDAWADKTCGKLKGAWLYSDWDVTLGRSTWGSSFCDLVV